jgi:hypothetical protein
MGKGFAGAANPALPEAIMSAPERLPIPAAFQPGFG